jgi:hypothetical protein
MQRVLDHIGWHLDDDLDLDAMSGVAAFLEFHFRRQFTGAFGLDGPITPSERRKRHNQRARGDEQRQGPGPGSGRIVQDSHEQRAGSGACIADELRHAGQCTRVMVIPSAEREQRQACDHGNARPKACSNEPDERQVGTCEQSYHADE